MECSSSAHCCCMAQAEHLASHVARHYSLSFKGAYDNATSKTSKLPEQHSASLTKSDENGSKQRSADIQYAKKSQTCNQGTSLTTMAYNMCQSAPGLVTRTTKHIVP
jgi:hypothetical protein